MQARADFVMLSAAAINHPATVSNTLPIATHEARRKPNDVIHASAI